MSFDESQLKEKSEGSIEHLKKEMGKLRSGRASSGLVEGIMVEYFGTQVPLQQLGLINVPEPRTISIQVYDGQAVESIEKAIHQSGLGLNPSRDGTTIRLNIPSLTEERRKDMVKTLHKMGEETKIAMRNHRREAIDERKTLQKNKEISEDDLRRDQDAIQKVTDHFVKVVDELVQKKEKEMMEV